ncbi:hypothetical protein PAT3040_02630 [Paenibacillus agaridevorans]|uniref:Thioredoxin domain-containing protein n=1 Tax=Paenibacillus agaridevorans TaxID=171404 RepID=A0A2R5EW99_9BACL|nr:stalk domain-containing protein [Paenibacillus agaridevorans]GBG08063.1 hypothetical protein PAT3040_02630 [Paenibacillus agaridevorans]
MLRKWKMFFVIGTVISLFIGGAVKAGNDITVMLEGNKISFPRVPIIVDGTAYVPYRSLFEYLGLQVEWHEKTKTITGNGDGIHITFQLNNHKAVVNGNSYELYEAPQLVDGVTYVPIRFVADSTGRPVHWEDSTRTISIGKGISFNEALTYETENILNYETSPLHQAMGFTLKDIDGKNHSFSFDKKLSKPVVINFWASWCKPSVDEVPALKKIQEEYGDQVDLITINVDSDLEVAAKFVAEKDLNYLVLYDADSDVGRKYGVYSIPQTFFINEEGAILYEVKSNMTENELKTRIEHFLLTD